MKNSTLRSTRSRVAFYALATILTTSSLLAAPIASADKKIIPATICQVWGGDKNLAEYLSYSQFGKIANTHPSQNIGIVCPIMRDRPDKHMDVRVYYSDAYWGLGANNVGLLGCRLRSNNVWGTASFGSTAANSHNHPGTVVNGLVSGHWTFYNLPGQTGNTYFQESSYTLFCTLPPVHNGKQSLIGSIITNEN